MRVSMKPICHSGGIEIHLLQESIVRMDGGAMFGHVPRVVWHKLAVPDEQNRLACACNCLLVKAPGRNIVIEAGMGNKWNEKEVGLYDLKGHSFAELLAPHGLTPAAIHLVIVSHLHIDHAGGLTRWDATGAVVPTFPNATVVVQRNELCAASNPDPRSRPSYRAHDFLPIEQSGKLRLVDGNGVVDAGIEVIVTGGHTAWHQVVRIEAGDETVWFLADLFPSSAHLKPHWVMGYDLIPLEVMRSRTRLLPVLAKPNVVAVFGHDPYIPVARIIEEKGAYRAIPLQ